MSSYHHFTIEERESLHIGIKSGKSIRQIAKEISRSPSTISRELARNQNKDGTYNSWRATTLYIIRRKNSRRPLRLETDKPLFEWVCSCLNKYWSPEIITAKWKQLNTTNKLSHNTIYSAIKRGLLKGYNRKTHLRRRGRRKNTHNSATIHGEHLIREWPDKVVNRERIGDWEGDTVYGAVGKGLLVTCVDRKSRYLVSSLLKSREVKETKEAVIKALSGLPVKTLSLDNGSEFAAFKEIEKELKTTIYFADPHSPWQRGSNENINDVVRFFFPKGTNFHEISQQELDYVVSLINNRPRKCLGWLSPAEIISAECCT